MKNFLSAREFGHFENQMEGEAMKVESKNLVLYLGIAMLVLMASAFAQTTTAYKFETINDPDDTFTQLLGINNAGKIAGYHGASINKGFTVQPDH